ncbi:suppressor of fused domain protein [Rudaeicoccus suwonensis]|uniref:suppressor of fused domain protein n=1 Tax=Rudaeicoccus suwonensis TaxID=657409 RepID=UPI0011A4CD6E|nr:suppressor of fused domain protein [Rudaeicoccus suwonensis]
MADFPPCDDVCGALEEHARRFFAGRQVDPFTWAAGPILTQNPHFRALRIAPAVTTDVWTSVSIGGWAATGGDHRGTEFVICTPSENARAVELLAMTVFYNRGGKLGIGHTLPIGEP